MIGTKYFENYSSRFYISKQPIIDGTTLVGEKQLGDEMIDLRLHFRVYGSEPEVSRIHRSGMCHIQIDIDLL